MQEVYSFEFWGNQDSSSVPANGRVATIVWTEGEAQERVVVGLFEDFNRF